jgi:hypothetical protein
VAGVLRAETSVHSVLLVLEDLHCLSTPTNTGKEIDTPSISQQTTSRAVTNV